MIRTRFAPSPTGYLHIGGVRTALFNWLLTRRLGGQFILRIDDTDTERNKPEALQPILDGFRWLGLNWDEGPEIGGPYGPYFQSQRSDRYRAAAMQLLETGHAYPDYMTKEELEADRKAAEAAKRPYIHRGPHREMPTAECVRLYREKPTTLRFKIPLGKESIVEDLICGHCVQKTDLIGDPVILRVDGRPLYNFASVIDDVDMKITHVIRAREHLSNTYVQVAMFWALGVDLPKFGHVPVINEPGSNKKLSKRDMKKFLTPEVRAKLHAIGWTDEQIESRDDLNPVTVAFYREMCYLPAAVVNYLGRLGWSLDDKTEFIPLDQMIANFGLERVNDSPARFDPDKLYWLAGEYMRLLPMAEKVKGCIPFLKRAGMIADPTSLAELQKLERVLAASGDRIKLFSDVLIYGGPFFKQDPVYDEKAVLKKLKKAGAVDTLRGFVPKLQATEPFDAPALEKLLHGHCTEHNLKHGDLVHPLRVAVTGVEVGIGLFDTLAILGRNETLRRIELGLKIA
ncbi:MAG TPA: glutamate--tRNA ligase [Gemmataceae bacterium]|nr:glutamate--tRNA ligase [Gemmataceae bacterium]